MTARDFGDLPSLNQTIARLQDETDRAELCSYLGGLHYQRYRAKLAALIAARTEFERRNAERARRAAEQAAREVEQDHRDGEQAVKAS